MPPTKKNCTFRKLYQSEEERFVVYQGLNELFKIRFAKVVKEAKAFSPYLVEPANFFENNIKDKYIDEGYKLECIEDLEIILKELNYIKYKDFRDQKRKFDSEGVIEESIEKRVKFDE